MASLMFTRSLQPQTEIPRAGLIINVLLSMFTISTLAVCFTRRLQSTRDYTTIPVTRWLLFIIYIDSMLFIVATATLSYGFGVNLNQNACSSAILLCLACYMTTKIVRNQHTSNQLVWVSANLLQLIYYFLIEKVYIIRKKQTPRFKSRLYLFNVFGMLMPYMIVVVLNFYYRIAYLNKDGTCIIGMEKKSMMPLIIFDAVLNLYLTLLFVIPLRGLYSYKSSPNSAIRTIAFRSFIGSCLTLVSSLVNLTVLMVLKGEPAWVCLMCCNADILFCVVVLHWVTSKDSSSTIPTSKGYSNSAHHTAARNGTIVTGNRDLPHSSSTKPTVTTHISAAAAKDIEEADEETKSDWERHSGSKENPAYALGKMRVQVGRTVEIESHSAGSEASTMRGEELTRVKSDRSTEDLVDRTSRTLYHQAKYHEK